MLIDYVYDSEDQDRLNADFQVLVRCYERHNLMNGRNLSVYRNYVRRLAERRGIRLTKEPHDIKTEKFRAVFDERFHKARKILGWPRRVRNEKIKVPRHRIS